MADPRGVVFVSYRRRRLQETNALVDALRDRGVPTWRDVDDLVTESTETAVREALRDERTSGAILWLTPDVKDSPIIRDVEVPEAIRRRKRDPQFWVTIILAEGLDYSTVQSLFADSLGPEDLSTWNLTKVSNPWASATDIQKVATSALIERTAQFSQQNPAPSSARVTVHAKGTMVIGTEDILSVDWTHHFDTGIPTPDAWALMADAASDLATALKQGTPTSTALQLGGTPSIPAATLLGSTFSSRDGRNPSWLQRQPDGEAFTEWKRSDSNDSSLAGECGWRAAPLIYRVASANSLAVCVNISDDVTAAFARSRLVTPSWRAVLVIEATTGRNTRAQPLTRDEAASLVHLTVDAIRSARADVLGIDSIHLFIAGPAGFAFLLGTAVATLPPITTYEYDTISSQYVPAATFST